jgi:hypothetical protein
MSGDEWKTRSGFPPADLNEAEARLKRLRPALRRRIWPPMSYMLIPSVLGAADRLMVWLEGYEGPQPERAEVLRIELEGLRRGFRREA